MGTVNVLCCHYWPQDEAFRDFTCRHHAPQGDEQLAGERHNHSFSRFGTTIGCPGPEPLHKGTLLLEHQHAPGQLDHAGA